MLSVKFPISQMSLLAPYSREANQKRGNMEFLIRIDTEYFLARVDGTEITGTGLISSAMPFAYEGALRLVRRLRKSGYAFATVTDTRGGPVTQHTFTPDVEPLPRNKSEVDKIPASELKRRVKKEPLMAQRLAEIYSGILKP